MAVSDMRNVAWGATVKLAIARGFASALVLTIVGLVMGFFSGPSGGPGLVFKFLLFWTFGAAIGGIVYIWMLRAIAATLGRAVGIVVTIATLMQFIVVLLVAIGDPLVYALNQAMPHLLDVADFKFFNPVAVIFIKYGGEDEEISIQGFQS